MSIDPRRNLLLKYDFSKPPGQKPDIVDLIGPWFDRPRGEPAPKTLIICAAPRTGSNSLARLLLAAGIGVPHEYFNAPYAGVVAARWGLPPDPLAPGRIGGYIDELRRRRCAGDVFVTKLQYWQYCNCLSNEHGRTLFDNAGVIHLFRADVFRQFLSVLKAVETGKYDFSERATRRPQSKERVLNERNLLETAEALMSEDAGFRKLFIFLGIRPIFVEFEELNREPRKVIERIAQALSTPIKHDRLDQALASAAPYGSGKKNDMDREARLRELMQKFAFQER